MSEVVVVGNAGVDTNVFLSVSYTHLDVYKRQLIGRMIPQK